MEPILLLAAGNASRLGTPKGLFNYHGRPWLSHQLERLAAIGAKEVWIVLGSTAETYQAALTDGTVTVPKTLRLQSIINPTPEDGPFSSILCGLHQALRQGWSGVWVLPIDVPCASTETWQKMLSAEGAAPPWVIQPDYQGRGGHPVWLSTEFANQLLTVPRTSDDFRLDRQIHQLERARILRVTVNDRAVTMNLNTADDFAQLSQ